MYLFIFYLLSIAIVAFNKSSGYFKEGYIIKDLNDIKIHNRDDVSKIKMDDITKFLADMGSFYLEAFFGKDNKKDMKNLGIVFGFLTFTYIFLIVFRWGLRTINHQTFLFLCWFLPFFIVIPSSLISVLNLYKLDTKPISGSETPSS